MGGIDLSPFLVATETDCLILSILIPGVVLLLSFVRELFEENEYPFITKFANFCISTGAAVTIIATKAGSVAWITFLVGGALTVCGCIIVIGIISDKIEKTKEAKSRAKMKEMLKSFLNMKLEEIESGISKRFTIKLFENGKPPITMETEIRKEGIIFVSEPIICPQDMIKNFVVRFRVLVDSNLFLKYCQVRLYSEYVTLETAVRITKLLEANETEKVAKEYFGYEKDQKGESNHDLMQKRMVLKTRAEILLARMENNDEAGASLKEVQQ